ncbi:MAG TPA: hypothetical protein VG474_13070, partial [Solirubrobacteraceae bacterium]|nr:hypothetical protein [Solirubrobacteraceae bacterium]
AAVQAAWSLMPADRTARTYELALPGVGAQEVLDGDGHEGHVHDAESDEASGDGGHHHGDMMAITGEPSADGLVMEAMDVQAGPLGVSLPGGLLVQASLDGDVVAGCQVRATLTVDDIAPPDPWSALAWTAAQLAASERVAGVAPHAGRWFRLAAVEVERSVSHLAWLHGFCRLLGWQHMARRARAVLTAVASARASLPVQSTTPDLPDVRSDRLQADLAHAYAATVELADALTKSRALALRTTGVGTLSADEVQARRLAGPIARASGVGDDARRDDPGYARLGFEPLVREEGDARARTLLRAAEAAQALTLAAAATELAPQADGDDAAPQFGLPSAGLVESARGPLRVVVSADGAPQRGAAGARAARQAAGELAVGREWAAALVTVASFAISPWRVGP